MTYAIRNKRRTLEKCWREYCERKRWVPVNQDGDLALHSDFADGYTLHANDPECGVGWVAFVPGSEVESVDFPQDFRAVPLIELSKGTCDYYRNLAEKQARKRRCA